MTNTKNKNKGNLFKGTCFDKMSKTRLIISKGEGIELKKGKRFNPADLFSLQSPQSPTNSQNFHLFRINS